MLQTYNTPTVSQDRLENAAKSFEAAIQKRLKTRQEQCVVHFDLDVFRYCFGKSNASRLFLLDDFKLLPMSSHWFHYLNVNGQGKRVKFPIKILPIFPVKRIYVCEKNNVTMKTLPRETISITCCTSVCDISSL